MNMVIGNSSLVNTRPEGPEFSQRMATPFAEIAVHWANTICAFKQYDLTQIHLD